ncbi:MAG TPA: FkbM family methyltransferase [Solirubrobacteraceae bacterium]
MAWRRSVGERFAGVDRHAHRAYAQFQRALFAVRLSADLRSLGRYLRVESRWARAEPVSVRVRPLGGAPIRLRPGTSDALVLRETLRDKHHSPPPEIAARGVRNIVDLGANVGITVADNALTHPGARIVAVELDPGNAETARRNCAPWAERCQILQGAVWVADGEVAYERGAGGEQGFTVVDGRDGARTRALSMQTILAHVPRGERVDYMKMDIEGVERRLLSGGEAGWAERIDSIALQVHDPYTLEECARDLAGLGFEPRVDGRRMNYIVGVRR